MTTMNEERAAFDEWCAREMGVYVDDVIGAEGDDLFAAYQAGAARQRTQSARVPEGLSLDLRDIHGALAAAHSAFVYRGQSTSCEYALTRVAKALHEVANALHAGDREDE